MSNPPPTAGIDAGATLCKLVLLEEKTIRSARYSSDDIEGVRACLREWRPERVTATGGGADGLVSAFDGLPVQVVSEFDAWTRGAPLLAERAGTTLPERYLLVSVGTGTSALFVTPEGSRRVGGTALGGGTVVGLGRLMAGASSFRAVADLASRGDRRKVDLLVRDIYGKDRLPLPGDLNASSFGKLASEKPEDLAHAIMGLVGENVALICGALSREFGARAVVYGGATIADNPALVEILDAITQAFGGQPLFLDDGAYCGAIGAAALTTAER